SVGRRRQASRKRLVIGATRIDLDYSLITVAAKRLWASSLIGTARKKSSTRPVGLFLHQVSTREVRKSGFFQVWTGRVGSASGSGELSPPAWLEELPRSTIQACETTGAVPLSEIGRAHV